MKASLLAGNPRHPPSGLLAVMTTAVEPPAGRLPGASPLRRFHLGSTVQATLASVRRAVFRFAETGAAHSAR